MIYLIIRYYCQGEFSGQKLLFCEMIEFLGQNELYGRNEFSSQNKFSKRQK